MKIYSQIMSKKFGYNMTSNKLALTKVHVFLNDPRRKGKLTIAKSKSSRLSYSEVANLPFESILSKISRYEADLLCICTIGIST
jgi:hypothetical protein